MLSTDYAGAKPNPEQRRTEFRTDHPYCSAAEIWRDVNGEPTLLRIECGTPAEHRPLPR